MENKELIKKHQEYKEILYKQAVEIYEYYTNESKTYGEAYKKIEDLKFNIKRIPELYDFVPIYELALLILEKEMRTTLIKK
ncbi:hypothetical protein RTF36_04015 [Mammaliicoccus sciuri]|uniref:hypothetical protein n=1 Tax=Mammaliicoccus sciuri TaxID=1296 RepID=UPI0028FC7367|nr:hypothetical protein [Mammaliicoccus sciuri]MDU0266360.1 hypothetical protein [Mammaliicoccus sciuri]